MKKLILSTLVLALTGGAAMADRGHGGGGGRSSGGHSSSGGAVVHNNGGGFRGGEASHGGNWNRGGGEVSHGGGWNRGGGVVVHENRGGGEWRGEARGGWRGDRGYNRGYRQNIWMPRPMIREHYYNYGYRPSLIVEDYGARDGYFFVRGDWQWNGYEWIWMPGHYEVDPDYAY
ncbi:MAG TPA: hypothetical protein VFQ65_17190 [Kofleriaceae bacterium]|nr:hypothetical protein [Kofleriaceae bacterium]